MCSRRVKERRETILSLWKAHKDATPDELSVALSEAGLVVATSTLHRFFVRYGITRKKTGHAIGQDRPDVLRQRQAWFDGQLDLHPERPVFIDETWSATNMPAAMAAAPKASDCGWAFPTGSARRQRWLPECA